MKSELVIISILYYTTDYNVGHFAVYIIITMLYTAHKYNLAFVANDHNSNHRSSSQTR